MNYFEVRKTNDEVRNEKKIDLKDADIKFFIGKRRKD